MWVGNWWWWYGVCVCVCAAGVCAVGKGIFKKVVEEGGLNLV